MPEEAAAAQGGAAAAVVFGTSAFKRPQYAAEVQDFLQKRAKSDEVQRVQRCMELIQKATGTSAAGAPTSHTFNTSLKPRPATTHCFTSIDKAKQQQQLRQQQQLQRLSTDSSASAPGAGSSSSSNKTSFLYTTTTAAAAAAARPFRPCSAQPSATTFAAPHPPAGAKAFRPASATNPAEKPQPRSGQNPTTSSAPGFKKSVNITTSQAMHGLKDLYPDMWASTVPICRPDPAPNKNFISEWGESLRQGAGEAWKPYLTTTSQLANLQVAKPTDDFAVRAEEALIGWVAKQQIHFADLLSPQAAAAVAALLEGQPAAAAAAAADGGSSGLSLSERKELLGVLRLLAAVVQPNRLKSTSHLQHCKQSSVETPATTALLKEQTRIRTMGFPRKVTVRGFRPLSSTAALGATAGATAAQQQQQHGSSSAAAAAAAAAGSSGSSRKPAVRASEMIDTQKSKVPLKWAASNLVPPCSTYTSAHGKHPGSSPQMFRTHFKEVNVGMGHVDQHMYPPSSHVYPVESLYLELPAKYRSQARDVNTTYRAAFPATAQAAA